MDQDAIEETAVAACEAGGAYLREQFRAANTAGQYGHFDVKAEADEESQRRMLSVIRERFPDHRITSEETGGPLDGSGGGGLAGPGDGIGDGSDDGSGAGRPGDDGPDRADGPDPDRADGGDDDGEEGVRWVVDPLDGTNNFVAGLPTFATGVAVLEDGRPSVAAVDLPVTEGTYVARRGEGVRFAGDPVRAESDLGPAAATVAFVVGHDVKEDAIRWSTATHLRDAVDVQVKRVIPAWAPLVYWGLLSRGLIQGVVAYHPDDTEQFAGELLAAESGARVRRDEDDGIYLAATNDRVMDTLDETSEPLR